MKCPDCKKELRFQREFCPHCSAELFPGKRNRSEQNELPLHLKHLGYHAVIQ